MKLSPDHQEPDRVPGDLGASLVTRITDTAYGNLLRYLGIRNDRIDIVDMAYATMNPHEAVLRKLGVTVVIKPKKE
jgi:uroporphyrinogen decarboxylase